MIDSFGDVGFVQYGFSPLVDGIWTCQQPLDEQPSASDGWSVVCAAGCRCRTGLWLRVSLLHKQDFSLHACA